MKTIKTCITNPELVKVGQCCEVRMSTEWMEMDIKEPYIYLPAKIKKVDYKDNNEIPCVTLYVRRCAKRGNYWPVENLMILPSQIGKKVQDHINEYHIEDYQTIIFK
jgi:hypothetical protein